MGRVIVVVIVFLFFGDVGYAQNISNSILDNLYIRAIKNRSDLIVQGGETYFEVNENVNRIKDSIKIPQFVFVDNKHLFQTALKNKKKSIVLISVVHKIVSNDTIDVNFMNSSVVARRGIFFLNKRIYFKNLHYYVGCRGTNGYHFDIRFVLNRDNKEWELLDNSFAKLNRL